MTIRNGFFIVILTVAVCLFWGCDNKKNQTNSSAGSDGRNHSALKDKPEQKPAVFEQNIKLIGFEKKEKDSFNTDKRLEAKVHYTLTGSTELGTVRIILMNSNGIVSQHHKIVKQGFGDIVLPIGYQGTLKNCTLIALLFRDEQEASGTMDKITF